MGTFDTYCTKDNLFHYTSCGKHKWYKPVVTVGNIKLDGMQWGFSQCIPGVSNILHLSRSDVISYHIPEIMVISLPSNIGDWSQCEATSNGRWVMAITAVIETAHSPRNFIADWNGLYRTLSSVKSYHGLITSLANLSV